MSRRIARLKPKKIKGRIRLLKALPYKGIMLCVRLINQDIFEYLFAYEGQVYTSYIVITPKKGFNKLTKDEISQSTELIWAGGEASIETILGSKLDGKKAEVVKAFEGSRKQVEKVLQN